MREQRHSGSLLDDICDADMSDWSKSLVWLKEVRVHVIDVIVGDVEQLGKKFIYSTIQYCVSDSL